MMTPLLQLLISILLMAAFMVIFKDGKIQPLFTRLTQRLTPTVL